MGLEFKYLVVCREFFEYLEFKERLGSSVRFFEYYFRMMVIEKLCVFSFIYKIKIF